MLALPLMGVYFRILIFIDEGYIANIVCEIILLFMTFKLEDKNNSEVNHIANNKCSLSTGKESHQDK